MNISRQVVILSAELSSLSKKENERRNELLNDMLVELNFSFNSALGVYKGVAESSFVVLINDSADLETLKNFAFKSFNQESVLHQDSNQEAFLIYQNESMERLGRLEEISKEEAKGLVAYTEMNGKYYTAKIRT